MDDEYDPEGAIWRAAVATLLARRYPCAEAFENANLVLAAYRRRRAESRGSAEILGGLAAGEDGADSRG